MEDKGRAAESFWGSRPSDLFSAFEEFIVALYVVQPRKQQSFDMRILVPIIFRGSFRFWRICDLVGSSVFHTL